MAGSTFSEERVRTIKGNHVVVGCPHCGGRERPTWDHVMWSCPRFGREQDRPADALAARNGWPSREAGAVWTVQELCEAKERVLQMARIYRNVKDL
eukprot:8051315-Alexandrium_andersonii.AAC.1